jgi:peptidoglycan/xylan/chitin deacetylase (PgdA/CDA1 family)
MREKQRFGFLAFSLLLIIIIGSSSFLNMALSKSSSHIPLLTSDGISINGGTASSNINGTYNQSFLTSRPYFAHAPSDYTLDGNISGAVNNTNNKVVMIGFDDGWKSQITYAKPILDKYGFKASFFVVCNYANSGNIRRMNWQDIAALQKDGMDIESHTMDHKPLNMLSWDGLLYEIAGSKQCLADHGIDSSIFAYPFNQGSNIKREQPDCRTYLPDGQLTSENRYDIRSKSFFHISSDHNYTPSEMFQKFIQEVNSQVPYNNDKINAVPIITYHNLTYNIQDYNKAATTITVPLFDQEMKYLHDNGFKVLLLNQLGFDPTNNILYLKDFPSSNGTTTNLVSAYGTYSHLDEMSQRSRSSNAVNFAMNRQ